MTKSERVNVEPNSDAWRIARQSGVGASEVASLVGTSPYMGPRTLYHQKRGEIEPAPPSLAMRVGSLVEPVVASLLADDLGVPMRLQPGMFRRADAHHHLASIDAAIDDERLAELKMTSERSATDLKDGPFLHWLDQAQWQMHVTGASCVIFGVLIGNRDFRTWHVMRNDTRIDELRDAVDAFWKQVQDGDAPPHTDADQDGLRRVRPAGSSIELSEKSVQRWMLAERLEQHAKGVQKRVARLKSAVLDEIGTASVAVLDDTYEIRRSTQTRKSYTVAEKTIITTRKARR